MRADVRLAWAGAVAVVAVSAAPAWQFRNWQWFALAVTVAVVLPALAHDRRDPHVVAPDRAAPCGRRRSPVGRVTAAVTGAGALAALAWSVAALLDGAGTAGFVQAAAAPALALDTAAVLGALLLLPAVPPSDGATPDRIAARLGAMVLVTAVAVLGFRLGAGDAAGALAAAAAVVVAGCPCALLLLPVPARGPSRLRVRAEHGEGVLRAAAALHAPTSGGVDGPRPADPVGRAVLAAAGRRYPTLPGVSDADGVPATGLRGVVSELAGDVVLAHAVLAGPPDWLRAHGVPPRADALRAAERAAGPVWCVAWDGEARGWLELTAARRPGTRRRRVAVAVTAAAAGLGAVAAAAGALAPAAAGAVPVGAALLVVALRMIPAPDGPRRGHPTGATSG